MKPNSTIRSEKSSDIPKIRALLCAAFPTDDEASLVDRLRADAGIWGEAISLVAVSGLEEVLGYALLSRCWVGGGPALALAPVAVHPRYQNQKIGTELVTALLGETFTPAGKNSPPVPIIVLGDPAYYSRFGFQPAHRYGIYTSIKGIDANSLAEALQVFIPAPDFTPQPGAVIYPTEFHLDQGSDL